MAIEITVGEKEAQAAGIDPNSPPDIVIDIKGPVFTIKLDARKTLDNNIIVYDHRFFNVVFVPFKNKILTMPKPHVNRDTYSMQSDYLTHLESKGAIQPGTTMWKICMLIRPMMRQLHMVKSHRRLKKAHYQAHTANLTA